MIAIVVACVANLHGKIRGIGHRRRRRRRNSNVVFLNNCEGEQNPSIISPSKIPLLRAGGPTKPLWQNYPSATPIK